MNDAREFGGITAFGFSFERDGARHKTAVEFRQYDVHRKIGGIQTATGLRPRLLPCCGEYGLQHRNVA